MGIGVVIRSVEIHDLEKHRSDSACDSVVYDQVKTESSELQAEAEELNQSQNVGTCIFLMVCPSASASDSDNLVLTRPLGERSDGVN